MGAFLVLLLLGACVPMKSARVASVALTLEDVARAAARQNDPELVRAGTPAFLMLIEGLLEAYPDNQQLHLAACQAYASHAASLPLQAGASTRMQALFLKARHHGHRSLPHDSGSRFAAAAADDMESFKSLLREYKPEDVPALFWTTAAWGGWIGASQGRPEALADLPALEAAMQRTLELDESYHHGGPHLLMAVYLSSKPPVSDRQLAEARKHFDRAFELGGDQALSARVLFAEHYARGMRDRELYESTLKSVLETPDRPGSDLTLANALARERARMLLERTKEYFDGPS
jgi:hypothetical protein